METQDTTAFGPPPSPGETPTDVPPPYRPPLRRSMSDKMLGGVCGGIGRRYGIDPAIPRVVFVVAILAAGVGLLAYLALWLLIPADTEATSSPVTNSLWRLVLGVLLALGGVAAVLGWMPWLLWVGVGGVAVWLYFHYRSGMPANNGRAARPQDPLETPAASAPATGFAYGGTGESAAYPPSYPPAPGGIGVPPGPPKQRSYLGLITILVMLMVAGLLGAAMAAGLVQITAVAFLSILLVVLAVGLIVAAFVGRARWLIAPALFLALLTGAVAAVPPNLTEIVSEGVGERVWEPTSSGEDYELGVGQAVLDLRTWAAQPEIAQPVITDNLEASVGLGELQVLVPATWQVLVEAEVGIGDLVVNGQTIGESAAGVDFAEVLAPTGDAAGQITLKLQVDVGQLVIRQVDVPVLPVPPDVSAPSGADESDSSSGSLPENKEPADKEPTKSQDKEAKKSKQAAASSKRIGTTKESQQ